MENWISKVCDYSVFVYYLLLIAICTMYRIWLVDLRVLSTADSNIEDEISIEYD